MIYPKRVWNDFSCHVYLLDEGRWVDLETMDEAEFRRFVLWRMGVALPRRPGGKRALESLAAPPGRRARLKYDAKRVASANRR